MALIGNSWDGLLEDQFRAEYYLKLREFLKQEYSTQTVYPNMYQIFNALKITDYDKVKAVILGQDPYHGEGQAHGLCFSVQKGIQLPPSLKNIYKEMETDLGIPPVQDGDLTAWAEQGVLLLNTVLTVRGGLAASHKGQGWEQFTDRIITLLNERTTPMVFILWGSHARAKKELISNPSHLVLEAAHPSPLSAHNGFFGCRHFSKTNEFLKRIGTEPINWSLSS
ncbi:MAG: uracil-DNA glycosylase [Clostridia bacterium]|nr:uracil-DNA glycosylase [Clostridia bacterium]